MQFTIRPATPANASYRGIVPDDGGAQVLRGGPTTSALFT